MSELRGALLPPGSLLVRPWAVVLVWILPADQVNPLILL